MIHKAWVLPGLVLLAFLVGHSLGLISLNLMETSEFWSIGPWRTSPGTILVNLAILGHAGIGVSVLYRKRTLRSEKWQWIQLQVARLFADLRKSTKLAEDRLPFDLVFIFNQFFAELSLAFKETGRHYAQFNGDGLMALYDLDYDLETPCRDALKGAERMFERHEGLNTRFANKLAKPSRWASASMQETLLSAAWGRQPAPIISALGDNANIANRLGA